MKVVLVIDMLNDFMEKGGSLYCGDEGRKIIPFIKDKVKECRASGCRVVYSCDAHAPDDREFKLYSAHAVKGSRGGRIIDELKPEEGDIIVEKTTVRPFYRSRLEDVLRRLAPDEVIVTGVCTSICVMEAVAGLSVRGYKAVVYKAGVADLDKESHEAALKRMKTVYGASIE